MKMKIIFTFLLLAMGITSFGQTFEIRAQEGDEGYLYIQMRETSGTGTPTTSNNVTDIVFQIKWLQSLGDVDMGTVICTDYEITKSGTRSTQGSYYYQEYYANNTPFAFPVDWVQNQWETIAKMEVAGTTSGTGTFEVGDNNFVPTGVNIGVDLIDYTPTVNGSATNYAFPTIIYDYVWNGGTSKAWDLSSNWEDQCGGAVSSAPTSINNCYIPGGLTNYPNEFLGVLGQSQPTCNILRIASGATFQPDDVDISNNQLTYTVGDLLIFGTVALLPDRMLTATGNTYIDGDEGLLVASSADGTGSFIDNGTINYGTGGSARVQTFLHNGATAGSFWIHLVGPTVDITGTPGVNLGDFNLGTMNTFAYQWDETVPKADGWDNVYNPTTPINTGTGLALSTNDATDHTLNMTGDLLTGPVSTPLTYSNNHLMLISNPYPSALDFDAFAGDNSSDILNTYWMWDPAGAGGAGNWISRSGGTGDQKFIQVGQGFFVETVTGTTSADFANTHRAHSNDAFRDVVVNNLHVTVEGGQMGYKDNVWIHFSENEEVTNGYDPGFDSEKWASYYEDATSIWTVTEDSMAVQVNQLPVEGLRQATSVPMSFICGYEGEYTLHFEGVESFDNDAEIWLEDVKTGGDWVSLNDNPDYTFTASPDDPKERFIIHFFNVTGTDQHFALDPVRIYSYGNYAYVVNMGDKPIEHVFIYNMSGGLVLSKQVPDQKVNKIWVDNKLAYYIVKVVTDEKVYTQKVLISYY